MAAVNGQQEWLAKLLQSFDTNELVLRSFYEFFVFEGNIAKVLPIVTGKSRISIRVLDWFVTNYAKRYNVMYPIVDPRYGTTTYFNVYVQYKSQLRGFKKKNFDPFCRKQRIVFYYEHNKGLQTTVGQLNFFKWAIRNQVLEYVDAHLDEITASMNSPTNSETLESTESTPTGSSSDEAKRVAPRRVPAVQHTIVHRVPVVLDFN